MSQVKKEERAWRSLAELEGRPEVQEFLEREFSEPLEHAPPGSPERRDFLRVMGASLALAGLSGCRWEEDRLVPHTRRPEGTIPGESRRFATTMEHRGVGVGLHVTSYDGRPIKVEGNPDHPGSRGAAGVLHQAAILELYDPDRARGVARWEGGVRKASSWAEATRALSEALAPLRTSGGAGLYVVLEPSSSPTLADLERRLREALPAAQIVKWSPVADDNVRVGSTFALGAPYRTHYHFDRADVVLTLDADPVGTHPNALAHTRALMERRDPDRAMSRLFALESSFTHFGSLADHRAPLRADRMLAVLAWLDAELGARVGVGALGASQPRPSQSFLQDAALQKFLSAVVDELASAPGRCLVVPGEHLPPEAHALAHRLNALLGNVGKTLHYGEEPDGKRPRAREAVATLGQVLQQGSVQVLLLLGGNPAYDAPSDVPLAELIGKAKLSFHLSLHENETSKRCHFSLPLAHWLESFGDALSWDGTLGLRQPLIAPMFDGRSAEEVLSLVLGEALDGLTLLRRTHPDLADDRRWRRALHDGLVPGPRLATALPALVPIAPITLPESGEDSLEVVFQADPALHDGRFANNAWLVELPNPFTKVSWDNVVHLAPSTARKLKVEDGTLVKLTVDGKTVTLPAVICPGQAPGSLLVHLGWGRTDAGAVAGHLAEKVTSVGVNVYPLRTTLGWDFAPATLQPTGQGYLLAGVQDRYAIDDLGTRGAEERLPQLVREAKLDEYQKNPRFAHDRVHHPPLLNLWVDPVRYDGHKWGMTVDLNKCTGCSACIVACQAENNSPVVGKAAVERGREMYWLRIDRYYRGSPDAPTLTFQPVTCHHCENAPCEQVCPVGATLHSAEGLNDMVYNRCIGTRYCSNNCPYKVRKFNYFNFRLDLKETQNLVRKMAYNPEVTLRSRGVMEKCTFCVQRIQKVKIKAKNVRRAIADGEIQTACQQTCPAGAIRFGDLNDGNAQVRHAHYHPRSYAMLGELNNRPRLHYLARVKNPKPELA